MTSLNLILGGVSCAFCQHRRAPRGRADGSFAPQTETHGMKIRLPASHSQSTGFLPKLAGVIAAFLPLRRRLREPVERLRTMLRCPAFPRLRTYCSGVLQILPAQVLAGRVFSFLRALVQHPQKSGRSVTHGFGFAPVHVLSSVALCHGKNHDSRSVGNAQIRIGEVRNVLR